MSGIATDPSTETQADTTDLSSAQRIVELEAQLAEMRGQLEAKKQDYDSMVQLADQRIVRVQKQRDEANRRLEEAQAISFSRLRAGHAFAIYMFGGEDPPHYVDLMASIIEYHNFRNSPLSSDVVYELGEMTKAAQQAIVDITTESVLRQINAKEQHKKMSAELEAVMSEGGGPGTFGDLLSRLSGFVNGLRQRRREANGQ